MTRANASRYASLSSISQIWMGAASTFGRLDESLAGEGVLLLILGGMVTGSVDLAITRSSDARRKENGRSARGFVANFRGAAQLLHPQTQVLQTIARVII